MYFIFVDTILYFKFIFVFSTPVRNFKEELFKLMIQSEIVMCINKNS